MRNQSFGVLKDGALLWAFEQDVAGLEKECYVIRSEDAGETWEGPAKLDKSPFPSVGNCSNRMTELPDRTVLWPQRPGLTPDEFERKREKLETSGQALEVSPLPTLTFSGQRTVDAHGETGTLCRIDLLRQPSCGSIPGGSSLPYGTNLS